MNFFSGIVTEEPQKTRRGGAKKPNWLDSEDAKAKDQGFLSSVQIAAHLKCSRNNAWVKIRDGCLVKTTQELEEWVKARQEKRSVAADLNEARKRKIELESERLRLRIEIDRGQKIDREKVHEAGVAAGAALVAELSVLANELPGQLAGLGELDIRDRLLARIDILVRSFRERLENLRFEHEAESVD